LKYIHNKITKKLTDLSLCQKLNTEPQSPDSYREQRKNRKDRKELIIYDIA